MIVTIENLAEASLQDVYNTIKNHLLSQGEKAIDCDGVYLYRHSKEGKRLSCAAGCLIPDDAYKPDMEFKVWHILVAKYKWSTKHAREIRTLQRLHDESEVFEWNEKLKEFAEIHNLIP